MRIISSSKFAEQFSELYDWVNDNTVEEIDQYELDDVDTIDYDALDRGEVPVTDDNVDNVLVDNLINEYGEEIREVPKAEPIVEEVLEEIVEEPLAVPTEEEAIEQETPLAEESKVDPADPKMGFGSDIERAIDFAIEEQRVLQIFYNTEGRKKGRGGKQYLKREMDLPKLETGGVNINRIVEPHYKFYAKKTKRLILVTYDRSVRHIRAFIIDNITDYNFTKKRGTDEDQFFRARENTIKNPNKGNNNMENINENLKEIGEAFQSKGLVKSAAIIQKAENALKNLKIAQYVGVQGYWIRNRRCWDNCYRQKRTTQPETPAQEVWMECLEEYKKSINDDKSGWEKYAKKDQNIKLSAKEEKEWNKLFTSKVSKKVKEGGSVPEAVYSTIEEESQVHMDKVLASSSQLMDLADTLSDNNMKDLGEKVAKISYDMLKESDFFLSEDVVKEAQFQGGNKGWGSLGRGWDKVKNWWTGEGGKSDVVKKMQDVINRANSMLMKLNMSQPGPPQPQQAQAKSKTIIIEAGKKTRVVTAQQLRDPKGKFHNPWEAAQQENIGRDRSQQIDQDAANTAKAPLDPSIDPAQTADNQNVQQQVQGQPNQQQLQQQGQMLSIVSKEFGKFMNDTQGLIKEFSGYVTSGDQETKDFASKSLPLLQGFINDGSKLYGSNSSEERTTLLRGSLENIISGLQGVLSGQESNSLDLGQSQNVAPQSDLQGDFQSTLQGAPQGAQQSFNPQQGVKPNMIDLDQIETMGEDVLIPLQQRIQNRLKMINEQRSKTGSYNHGLKISK